MTEQPKPATSPDLAASPDPAGNAGSAAKATPPAKATPAKAAKATPASKAARKGTRAAPAKAQSLAAAPPPASAAPATANIEATTAPPAPVPVRPATKPDQADTGTVAATTPAEAASVELEPQRTEAWAKLVADPGHAPELLALAAVQAIGPGAREWARRTRESYPTANDHGLARLAVRQFTRFGSLSSVFGAVAGSYAPAALLGAAALTQAELVLHVAAAYGADPTDEQRAADLLVLTRVHHSRADAEAAIAAAKQPAYEDDTKLSDAAWRFAQMAAAQAGRWMVLRVVNRFFPGTSLLVTSLASRSAAESVGHRATLFYSQESQSAGSRV